MPAEKRDCLALEDLATPALVLDEMRMSRNIMRLKDRLQALGKPLRPHLKTAKCLNVIRRMTEGWPGPITVSTLQEAEMAAAWGVRDVLYAVALAPQKLERVLGLRARGVDLSVVTDNIEAVDAIGARAGHGGMPILIEIDSDHHRSGLSPADGAGLIALAGRIASRGCELRGVLTHAGDSYNERSRAALEASAERERAAAVAAAEILRANGWPCPVVSVGSTPTAHFARKLDGVTEVRAGVFCFFDLVMAGIGVCRVDDIALSLLATVIGHQRDKGWILVDAGWMALSRDRGTAKQPVDQGYGVVCDLDGVPYPDLLVAEANQEHGILALRPDSRADIPALDVGAMVRIFPNHACATAAQHDAYRVARDRGVVGTWERFNGW